MILAIAFAHLLGVIQLIVLGCLARTVRVRTVLAALAVGLYAIGPLTVLLQLGWIHLAASVFGTPVHYMTQVASYTVDPFLEEALKLLPLGLLLLLIPATRRQWSLTDCVLIAAATGSGYGLAENLYRYAGSPDAAQAIAGGWAIGIGNVTVLVPGMVRSLTSWLPPGTSFVGDVMRLNSHLIWSAIGGLALGLIVRYRTRAARLTAGGLLLYIGLDHAAWNSALYPGSWLAWLAGPLGAVARWGGLLVIGVVVAAWWLDRPAQRTGETVLAAVRSAAMQFIGTFTTSVGGLRSSLAPSVVKHAVRRPAVIIALVCLVPSILYLIVGGWPQTAWLQRVMTGPVVWPVVLLITVLAQARLAWGVIVGVRNWSKTRQLPVGDDAAMAGLQLACGIGAVGLGGFALMRVLGGVSAESSLIGSAHGADAAQRATPGSASSVANSAGPVIEPVFPQINPATPRGPEAEAPPPPAAKSKPQPSAPKSNPYEDAAARAEAKAAQAEADARAAQDARQKAIRAQDAADIAKATGMDDDPGIAEARDRTRKANAAAEAADRAALDGEDPWDPNGSNKKAADIFNREAREALEDQQALEDAFRDRMSAGVDQTRAAATTTDEAMNAAARAEALAAPMGLSRADFATLNEKDLAETLADIRDQPERANILQAEYERRHAQRVAAVRAKEQADEAGGVDKP